ncbi:thioredoxin family protein [Paenibacillus humicola]|uniref:thioredoxin family protein n=1 Tax=Paenibacillus humicola TaxID=3110540 RepID=UPI00237BCAEA|nr:thioredoxin family protein [Paenibacillus humicola]
MERILQETQFQELINRDQYTVIKFDATWCPDCKNLDRFIGPVIDENPDKQFYALDVEQLPDIAEANEVRGIPSLLVYKNGVKLGHLHSRFAKTPAQVREYLDSVE